MKTWSELEKIQPLASKIIMNSIRENRVSHAYLIHGARGTGKKRLSTLLVMTLFCINKDGVEPCQTCTMCKRIQSGNHPDVHWVVREASFIKNEQIVNLRKEFAFSSMESDRKIYIIEDADLMTNNAANRLLKFLEEPDTETTAILLTSNVQAILPTIQSRCQLIDLQPLDTALFQRKLQNLQISVDNARFLSALTNNIDEAISYHKDEKIYLTRDLVVQLIEMLITRYSERYLFVHTHWLEQLKDRQEQEVGLDITLLAFNDIVRYQIDIESASSLILEEDLLKRSSNHFSQKRLLHILRALLETKQKMRQNVHPALAMEELVLQL